MVIEEKYMARCIELARHGAGYTSPNPMVGAVIVHQGRIIGEGFHRRAGEAHAEVNAIAAVKDPALLRDSTIYVNLEPCSHHGKTPPCAELLIRMKIPRVVIGTLDPFPQVAGRGVRILKQAGVEVTTGLLEKECRRLNRAFMTFQEHHRPYIYLKWAQSADGFIDKIRTDNTTPPVRFSTPETERVVHKLRSEVAAIIVGTRTALLDNPSLTVRHWTGRSPVRIVIDQHLRIPSHFHLFDGSTPTLVLTAAKVPATPNVEYVYLDFSRPLLPQLMNELYQRKLDSLLVEGGASLLNQFIAADLYDEVRVEKAPFNLYDGVRAPHGFDTFSPSKWS